MLLMQKNKYTLGSMRTDSMHRAYIMLLNQGTYYFCVHKSTLKSHIHPSLGGVDSIIIPYIHYMPAYKAALYGSSVVCVPVSRVFSGISLSMPVPCLD